MCYRGEIMISFKFRDHDAKTIHQLVKPYEIGQRVAQMIIMPYPHVDFVEVDELTESDRGEGGYGSTGK